MKVWIFQRVQFSLLKMEAKKMRDRLFVSLSIYSLCLQHYIQRPTSRNEPPKRLCRACYQGWGALWKVHEAVLALKEPTFTLAHYLFCVWTKMEHLIWGEPFITCLNVVLSGPISLFCRYYNNPSFIGQSSFRMNLGMNLMVKRQSARLQPRSKICAHLIFSYKSEFRRKHIQWTSHSQQCPGNPICSIY